MKDKTYKKERIGKNTNKTNVYLKALLFCPLNKIEQGIEKCFNCKLYKGVGTNEESTHLRVRCNHS